MWLVLPLFLGYVVAQYADMSSVISSSWSMWSPWSFCSNNVMVRVRACSTVRGFKCAGHNKEFQSCDSSVMHAPKSLGGPQRLGEVDDVDVVDSYSEDREQAMRQLYQDYEVEVPENERTSPAPRTRPAAPAELREPIMIAQYANRYPQPPGHEGIELAPPGSRSYVDIHREGSAAAPTSPSSTYSPLIEATIQRIEIPSTTEPLANSSKEEKFEGGTVSNIQYDTIPTTLSVTLEEGSINQSTAPSEAVIQDEHSSTPYPFEYVKESFPITPKKELFEEFEDSASIPVKEQFSRRLYATTSMIPTKSTVTSITNTTAPLPGALPAKFGRTQTAVNLKGTSFVVSAAQIPVRNLEPKLPRMPTLPPSRFHSASYERENIKGKLSRQQRLKKLNRRAKVRPLTLPPATPRNFTRELSNREAHQNLKKQVEDLRKQIRKTKKKLAATLETTAKPDLEEMVVEGDTARALSWMFANVAKMVDGKTDMPISDRLPVEKIDAETEQDLYRLPSGVEVISEQDQFVLKEDTSNDPIIKVDRQNAAEIASMEWSEWTNCNCGAQSRKTACVALSEYQTRQRRSPRSCKSPEYETRPCHSTQCNLQ